MARKHRNSRIRGNRRADPGRPRKRSRAVVLGIAAVLVLGGIIVALAAFLPPRPLRIGISGLDPRTADALSRVFTDRALQEGFPLETRILESDPDDPSGISDDLDALVLLPSMANHPALAQLAPLPLESTGLIHSPTLTRPFHVRGKNRALPLVIAPVQQIRHPGMPAAPVRLSSLLASASPDRPFLLAGGDDTALLDAVGMLVLELGGFGEYRDICASIAEWPRPAFDDPDLLRESLGPAFRESLARLSSAGSSGRLRQGWLGHQENDMDIFVPDTSWSAGILDMVTSRILSPEAREAMETSPMVLRGIREVPEAALPVLTARLPGLGMLPGCRQPENFTRLATWLRSPDGQEAMGSATRLAPTLLAQKAQDIQSRAARDAASAAWIIQGLSRDAVSTVTDRHALAEAVRELLRRP